MNRLVERWPVTTLMVIVLTATIALVALQLFLLAHLTVVQCATLWVVAALVVSIRADRRAERRARGREGRR